MRQQKSRCLTLNHLLTSICRPRQSSKKAQASCHSLGETTKVTESATMTQQCCNILHQSLSELMINSLPNHLLSGITFVSIFYYKHFQLLLIPLVFAMAALSVLAAIAGAIRVGGADWLKRLIGRARETTASAEIELMSSVSREVCELWNGVNHPFYGLSASKTDYTSPSW